MKYLFFWLLITASFYGQNIRDRIDVAIASAESGNADDALNDLQKLLSEHLTDDEKVSVLYNIASLYCQMQRYDEALSFFEKITVDLFEETKEKSPYTALAIKYNHAICLIKLSEQNLENRSINEFLEEIKRLLDESRAIAAQKKINPLVLTHAYEELAVLRAQSEKITFLRTIQQMNKPALCEMARKELSELFSSLQGLKKSKENIDLYIEDIAMKYTFRVQGYFARCMVFLGQNEFMKKALQALDDDFLDALKQESIDELLATVYMAIKLLDLVANDTIETLLSLRISNEAEYQKEVNDFAFGYLEDKMAQAQDVQQKLLKRLIEEMQRSNQPQFDLEFYKALKKPLDETFKELLSKPLAPLQFHALIARLEVEGYLAAIRDLKGLQNGPDRNVLVLKSWYLVHPKAMLKYTTGLLAEKVKSQNIEKELGLLLGFLAEFVEKHPEYKAAYNSLQKQTLPFDRYLNLFWLHSMLEENPKNAHELVEAIKSMQLLQQDLYYSFVNEPSATEHGFKLQRQLIKEKSANISKIGLAKTTVSKLTQIFSQIDTLFNNPPSQRTSQAISELLAEALKLLQEKGPEPLSKSEQKQELDVKMKKVPLELAPETSIRLLQEMEQQDAPLFEQPLQEKVGAKPW